MARIFCTTPRSFDVMSVMQPRSTFTTSRCSLPLAIAPRSCLHSSQSFLSLPAESAATILSLRLATRDWSALMSDLDSAVYTIMAPFLSGTTCALAPSARTACSQAVQSSQAEQSCATSFMWPEQIMPAAAAVIAAPLAFAQWSMPAAVALPCIPQLAPFAMAAFFAQAARIAGVHCAAMAAGQPAAAAASVVVLPVVGVAEAVEAEVAEAADLGWSHASAAAALHVQARSTRASSRSDFMEPTSRKVMTSGTGPGRGESRWNNASIGWPSESVSPAHAAGVRHVQKGPPEA